MKKSKRWKAIEPHERDEQVVFVEWLKLNGYRVHHSPNGGSRHILEAKNLKRMGVSSGFPDIFIPQPTPLFHGFFLEMKAKKQGRATKNQIDWINYLQSVGYYAEFANGFDEAIIHFKKYISTK